MHHDIDRRLALYPLYTYRKPTSSATVRLSRYGSQAPVAWVQFEIMDASQLNHSLLLMTISELHYIMSGEILQNRKNSSLLV